MHEHRLMEFAAILRGKFIDGDVMKIPCEQVVQHLDVLIQVCVVVCILFTAGTRCICPMSNG